MSKRRTPSRRNTYLKIEVTDQICKYLKQNYDRMDTVKFIKRIDPIELAQCTDDNKIWFIKSMNVKDDYFNPNEDYFKLYFLDIVNKNNLRTLLTKKLGLGINSIRSSSWFSGQHYVFYFNIYGRHFEIDKNVLEMTGLPSSVVIDDFYARVKSVFERLGKVSKPYIAFDFILRNDKKKLLRYHAIGVRIDPSDRRLGVMWDVLKMWEDPIPKGYKVLDVDVKNKQEWENLENDVEFLDFSVAGY